MLEIDDAEIQYLVNRFLDRLKGLLSLRERGKWTGC